MRYSRSAFSFGIFCEKKARFSSPVRVSVSRSCTYVCIHESANTARALFKSGTAMRRRQHVNHSERSRQARDEHGTT